MKVTIIENDSNRVIATYPIHIAGQNYTPTEEEYYSSAWENAVEDNLVEPDTRDKHTFSLEK